MKIIWQLYNQDEAAMHANCMLLEDKDSQESLAEYIQINNTDHEYRSSESVDSV